MSAVWSEVVSIAAVTLAHSLWQGALVAAGLALVLAQRNRVSSRVRYLAACGALLLLLAAPVATFAWLVQQTPPSVPTGVELVTPAEADIPGRQAAAPNLTTTTTAGRSWHRIEPFVVSAWLLGVAALAGWHLLGWWRLRRWTKDDLAPASAVWQERFQCLVERLEITTTVVLRFSHRVDVPMVVGWLRPVVLVPASLLGGLPAEQLELILLHELAHVRRFDYLVNLLQIGAETLLFFHPAAWWIGAVVRREREHCCDDLVVSRGGSALVYARALLQLEEMRPIIPIPAPTATTGPLLARIQRLTGGVPMTRYHSFWPRLAGVVLVAVLLVGGSLMAVAAQANNSADGELSPVSALALSASASARQTTEGDFKLREHDDRFLAQLEVAWHDGGESRLGCRLTATEYDRILSGEAAVTVEREAGRFTFRRETRTKGTFTFEPSADFVDFLGDRDIEVDDPSEVFVMGAVGMTRDWVQVLDDLRGRLDGGDIVAAGIHGVTGEFVAGIGDAGFDNEEFDSYLAMRIHGLDGDQLRDMRQAGLEFDDADAALAFRIHGLDADYIADMKEAGLDLDSETLLACKIHGVGPDYIESVRAAGFDLDAETLLAWKIHGVKPRQAEAMRGAGFADATAEDLLAWKIHGLTPALAEGLREAGVEIDDAEELLAMKIHGVTPEYVAALNELEVGGLNAENLLAARIHGVSTRWVETLQKKGIDLPLDQLVKLKISGVEL